MLNIISKLKKKKIDKEETKDNENKSEQKLQDDDSLMSILPPFWGRIKNAKRILLSGCGGGFDIYQGIPLFFQLRSMGYEVFLANYTFAYNIEYEKDFEMWYEKNDKQIPLVVVVSAKKVPLEKIKSKNYFPEYYLSLYFHEKQNLDVPIYTCMRIVTFIFISLL